MNMLKHLGGRDLFVLIRLKESDGGSLPAVVLWREVVFCFYCCVQLILSFYFVVSAVKLDYFVFIYNGLPVVIPDNCRD